MNKIVAIFDSCLRFPRLIFNFCMNATAATYLTYTIWITYARV